MPTILRTLDIMTIIQPVFPPCSDPNPTLSTQQAISVTVTVVLGDKLVSQICQAKSPGCYLRATGPRAPVSRDHCSDCDSVRVRQSQSVTVSDSLTRLLSRLEFDWSFEHVLTSNNISQIRDLDKLE